jgi:hypothetical protein
MKFARWASCLNGELRVENLADGNVTLHPDRVDRKICDIMPCIARLLRSDIMLRIAIFGLRQVFLI